MDNISEQRQKEAARATTAPAGAATAAGAPATGDEVATEIRYCVTTGDVSVS